MQFLEENVGGKKGEEESHLHLLERFKFESDYAIVHISQQL